MKHIKWPEQTQANIGYRLNQRIFPKSSVKEEIKNMREKLRDGVQIKYFYLVGAL